MIPPAEVTSRLARAVARTSSGAPLAIRVGEAARSVLGADGVAVTLACTTPQRVTLCATDAVAARVESLHDVLGEGPGVDAYTTGRPVAARIGDAPSAGWPLFGEAARQAAGPVSLDALPIAVGVDVVGVLTAYRSGASHPPLDPEFGGQLAAAVGLALLHDPDTENYEEDGSGPWSSRAEVHRATGFLVARLGIEPADALALLRARAYAQDLDPGEVARLVLEQRIDLSTPAGGPRDHRPAAER